MRFHLYPISTIVQFASSFCPRNRRLSAQSILWSLNTFIRYSKPVIIVLNYENILATKVMCTKNVVLELLWSRIIVRFLLRYYSSLHNYYFDCARFASYSIVYSYGVIKAHNQCCDSFHSNYFFGIHNMNYTKTHILQRVFDVCEADNPHAHHVTRLWLRYHTCSRI